MYPIPAIPLALIEIFGQKLDWPDLAIVGLLVILEGLLSIDNALVLGLLAKRLPKEQRARALSYGLIGAFVFRVTAILMASYLLQWTFVKLLGGGYLIFIAVKHLVFETPEDNDSKVVVDEEGNPGLVDAATGGDLDTEREILEIEQRVPVGASLVTESPVYDENLPLEEVEGKSCNVAEHSTAFFWKTVLIIELTDIAFAVDSILAAMALAGSRREKLWVVITGGLLGLILMRFAAVLFIKLLDRFPRFELSAYLLVIVIGSKLVFDWGCNSDWSFKQSPWLASKLGGWQTHFESFEDQRRAAAEGYHHWLESNWPLGVAAHAEVQHEPTAADSIEGVLGQGDSNETDRVEMPEHVPHLLDFHDLRRPESLTFWALMAASFGVGFLPKRRGEE